MFVKYSVYIIVVSIFVAFGIAGSSSGIDISTPESILSKFDSTYTNNKDLRLMQWWSVAHSFVQPIQIDIYLNKKELEALIADRHIVFRDLERFYYGADKWSFDVIQRGYNVRTHASASPHPHHLFWRPVIASKFLQEELSPYDGKTFRAVGSGRYGMAVEQLDTDIWHISFAKFMQFKSPY